MNDIYDDCKIVKKGKMKPPPDLAMYYVIKTLVKINSVFCVIYDLIHIISKELRDDEFAAFQPSPT